jgi:hypothetical protein
MMKWIFAILLCFLPFLSSLALAQEKGHGVEVRVTPPDLLEAYPGKIVTASFLVSNHTEGEEEFSEVLTLPVGWQKVVSDEPGFKLKAEGSQARIVAFLPPLSAAAGRYQISYSVRSQSDYAVVDSDSLSVVILPVVKLEILLESKPEVVIAGEAYQVNFRLLNQGNSGISARLVVRSSPDYPVNMKPSEITLDVGESRIIRLSVETDKRLKRRIVQILDIEVKAEEIVNGGISVRRTASIEIIPKVTGEMDRYHRLPVQVGLVVGGKEEEAGLQAEISGRGSLDEEGERWVEFLFRAPDVQEKSTYGKRDEFWVHYRYQHIDLHVGDRTYSLSPLTERLSYGRGLEADIHHGDFGFGGFYRETRWKRPKDRELATYLAYQLNDRFSLRGNLLGKSEPSTQSVRGYDDEIFSLQLNAELHEGVNLDLECGVSDCDREGSSKDAACRIDLKGQVEQIWYSFEKTYAGPDYSGYYKDVSYTSGAVTFPIHQKLRGNLSYRSYKNNLDLDSTRGAANREKSYRGGIRYSFPFGTSATFDFEELIREDHIVPANYNYEERALKLGLTHSFGKLSLNTQIERGRFENRLSGNANDLLERYSVYAHFRPDRSQTLSLYAKTGHSSFTSSPERIRCWGASAAWQIRENTSLSLNYRRDESNTQPSQERSSIFSVIKHIFPSKHALLLRGRWIRHGERKEEDYSFLATYTIPLRIPVSKKKSIGILKGKVHDEERANRPPIPRVILTAHGATAITDENGEFIFPSLQPGIYHLRVEKNSIGLNRVTTQKLPLVVEVKSRETSEIEIGVVTSGVISGWVALFALETDRSPSTETNSRNDLFLVGSGGDEREQSSEPREGGLANLLVQVANENEILRQFTGQRGRFSFEDLRPGTWNLKISSSDLPAHHYLEQDEFQIHLKPGEEKEIEVKVLPRLRPIEIIDEGEIK